MLMKNLLIFCTGLLAINYFCHAQEQPAVFAIEVNTKVAGTLYFQGEEIAELQGNDTYTIPLEKLGTYTIKLGLPNKVKLVRIVSADNRKLFKVNFNDSFARERDEGPGGGTIFYAEDGYYMEYSGELGEAAWTEAYYAAKNYRGGGFTDWRLPDKNEVSFMCRFLYLRGLLDDFSGDYYWSVTKMLNSNGYDYFHIRGTRLFRAVRAFSL